MISVLIPCYNAERYIGETLESVLRQSWPDIEIVVVNDGSTDDSASEIRRFKRSNLIFLDQGNRGAAASRNDALAASSGDHIQFLDADDLIAPDKLELQMKRLEGADECIASAEWGRFCARPEETHFEPEPVWRDMDPLDWFAESAFGMMFPALWLIPRSIALAAGPWNESLTLADDTEYFTRVLMKSKRVLFCEGARAYYRSGIQGSLSGRKSRGAWASAYEVHVLCEDHVMEREDSPRMRRMFAMGWQKFAHAAYPYDPWLAEAALKRAHHLDKAAIVHPQGGLAFRLAVRVLGWRTARRLQVASGRP